MRFRSPLSTPKVELRKSEVLIRKYVLLGGRALRFFSQSVNMSLQLQVVAEISKFNSDRVDFHGASLAQFPMPPDPLLACWISKLFSPKRSIDHRRVSWSVWMNDKDTQNSSVDALNSLGSNFTKQPPFPPDWDSRYPGKPCIAGHIPHVGWVYAFHNVSRRFKWFLTCSERIPDLS